MPDGNLSAVEAWLDLLTVRTQLAAAEIAAARASFDERIVAAEVLAEADRTEAVRSILEDAMSPLIRAMNDLDPRSWCSRH